MSWAEFFNHHEVLFCLCIIPCLVASLTVCEVFAVAFKSLGGAYQTNHEDGVDDSVE